MPAGTPKLHVSQVVLTKAWLGGKGEGTSHDERPMENAGAL